MCCQLAHEHSSMNAHEMEFFCSSLWNINLLHGIAHETSISCMGWPKKPQYSSWAGPGNLSILHGLGGKTSICFMGWPTNPQYALWADPWYMILVIWYSLYDTHLHTQDCCLCYYTGHKAVPMTAWELPYAGMWVPKVGLTTNYNCHNNFNKFLGKTNLEFHLKDSVLFRF